MKKLIFSAIVLLFIGLLSIIADNSRGPHPHTVQLPRIGDGAASLQAIENLGNKVILHLDGSVKPELDTLKNPNQLVIDLPNSSLGNALNREIPIQSSLIDHIQISLLSTVSSIVQVSIYLTQQVKATLQINDNQQIIIQLEDARISHYIVVIDPGHGGDDDGAESVTHRNEKDFNLSTALKVRDLLAKEPAMTTYLTRKDDTFISLDDRVDMANHLKADVFLSIHANIDKSSKTRGTETFFDGDGSISFAQTIQDYVQKATGFPDRHIMPSDYRVIKNTTMPAALIEVGFLSNVVEDKALFMESNQSQIAAAIVAGIEHYLGIAP